MGITSAVVNYNRNFADNIGFMMFWTYLYATGKSGGINHRTDDIGYEGICYVTIGNTNAVMDDR